ncbi:amino acid transporter [hydrothermal vent metagenome]|uniref:Amino acid transporter n=1 Tax=hydrothermal vent metagenome TaxID=652676 RepID=A0A1W1D3R4_9ZZZZ
MSEKKLGFIEAFSIGVGGMVGGGIFAVLGLTISLSGGAAPIAFGIAGLIALVSVYSYVKLSLRYPSEGGTIEFIVQGFGNGIFSALVNNLMLISYVIMLALYAYAFGSYGSALLIGSDEEWLHKSLSAGVIVVFAMINLMGSFLTGKAEDVMVFIKIAILILFVGAGFLTIDVTRMEPSTWTSPTSIATGGLMIFLAFEGFELIANTARDVKEPQKNLPLAYYTSVIFVILLYISVAAVAVGNLSLEEAKKANDYVLAIAAEPFFGKAGFSIIAIAAMLSTASAINATLYGGGRVSYFIAKLGELPRSFEYRIKNGYEGTIILALLSIIFTISFDLQSISVAGSAGFLLIFALVNLANFRLYKETKSNRFLSFVGFLISVVALIVLLGYNAIYDPHSLISSGIVISTVAMFTYIYYKLEHRKTLSRYTDKALEKDEGKNRYLKIHPLRVDIE